jgi:ABC-type glycerol-3-phosphate transport system substrate-binding protein
MSVDDTPDETGQRVPRRRFLKAAGASGVAVGLAGCLGGGGNGNGGGGDGTPSGTVKWSFDPTQAKENSEKIVQLFYDNGLSKDIDLKLVPASQKTGSVQSTYSQILRSGQGTPDMFMMDCGWTIPFIVRGQLVNLTKELSDTRISTVNNQYFDASVRTTKHPKSGDLYGVPLFPDFSTMQFRKDLVKKAGYQPDKKKWATNPMTWKRFNKITKDVMKKTGTKMGFSFQYDNYVGLSCCDFNEFLTSWGGAYFGGRKNLFGQIGKRPVTIAKKPVQKSQRMVRTFIHGKDDPEALSGYSKIAPEGVLSWAEESSRAPFSNGNVVMHRNWPYSIPLTINEADWATPETYGVMPIPYGVPESKALEPGTGGSSSALGGWHMTVNPNAKNKQGALEVIKTAMKKEVQIGIFEITGWLPPNKSVFTSKAAQKVKPTGKFLEALKLAGQNAISRPVTVVWPQESKATYQEVNPIASQSQPVQKGLNKLSNRLEKIEQQFAESN